MSESTITEESLRGILLASALESPGLDLAQADRLVGAQVKRIFHHFGGKQRYFAKGRKTFGMCEAKRREVFLECWTHNPHGHDLTDFLAKHEGISERRLRQIMEEGRRKGWKPK